MQSAISRLALTLLLALSFSKNIPIFFYVNEDEDDEAVEEGGVASKNHGNKRASASIAQHGVTHRVREKELRRPTRWKSRLQQQ
jgi:6,7-dimethyl-8-ribityllumazine synthase